MHRRHSELHFKSSEDVGKDNRCDHRPGEFTGRAFHLITAHFCMRTPMLSEKPIRIPNKADEHIQSGKPIFYTSADSVFQIACHEEHFGLENLYTLCKIVREELEPYNIARVIARPFNGSGPADFARTSNRKDYSLLPSDKTLFDVCCENKATTVAIGKIGDIYAHQGISRMVKANGNKALFETFISEVKNAPDRQQPIVHFPLQ